MTRRIVLIDGDILSYRVGFACEHKQYYACVDGEDMVFDGKAELNKYVKENECEEVEWESQLKVEPLKFALATAKNMVANIKAATKADEVEIYVTGTGNFREKVATVLKYKGNRDDKRRPLLHSDIIQYLMDYQAAVMINGAEADDELADRQLECAAEGIESVIASDDKDLLQIPGLHFNIRSEEKIRVTNETAAKNKYLQMLIGDSTDNIPGIYGLGPIKAEKVLEGVDPSQYRNTVETAWHDYFTNGVKLPEWLIKYDPESTNLDYTNKDGKKHFYGLLDFVDEIEALITVGVRNGKADQAHRT
jgi:hypothetical protein